MIPTHVANDSDTILGLYLRDMMETPLLTRQEEISLAKRIQKGDDAARDHMIRANLRLVVKIARDYEGLGLPLLDIINEGNMGLMRAVDKFDPSRGCKLSTYAAHWINQSIRRALSNQGKTIRVPVHLVDLIAKMRRAALRLFEENGREATDAEVAKAMGMKRKRVTELFESSRRPMSLDDPISELSDTTFAEHIPDEGMTTADGNAVRNQSIEMLMTCMDKLNERERTILRHRFGLGVADMTLEQLGLQYGLTRERVRQIQEMALTKLKDWMDRYAKDGAPTHRSGQSVVRAIKKSSKMAPQLKEAA